MSTLKDTLAVYEYEGVTVANGPETPGWLVIRLHKGKVDLG